jgi:hypothetical protein
VIRYYLPITYSKGAPMPRHLVRCLLLTAALALLPSAIAAPPAATAAAPTHNLIKNADLEKQTAGKPADFTIEGDVEFRNLRDPHWGFAFLPAKDVNADGQHQGAISQTITDIDAKAGRWFRFSFRGLPQDRFLLNSDALNMTVEFFAGEAAFDGKTKHLYSLIQQQRKDLGVNGDNKTGGAASWHTYQLDFMLPAPQVDRLKLTISFDHATTPAAAQKSEFYATDLSLVRIPGPDAIASTLPSSTSKPANLLPIGGRFFYKADPGETTIPKLFTQANADRLIYHDDIWSAPFAGSMSAVLRAGDLDLQGNLVAKDTLLADNVTVSFDPPSAPTAMVIHTHGIPNHPTGQFPGENPNYIQEKNATYYIPLNPQENPAHTVTAPDNSNHALPMGPIGVAANGIVFFNPFDADSQDASNIMDYCCGHPAPDNTYHYHKYPICINSPWADEGKAHSPLLGWAFDGFPIYGPYVKADLLAKDAKGDDALNDFNLHTDKDRGPHYQVTPGKFPYIIGGFWGTEDPRDAQRQRGPGGGGPGGPGGGGPPGGGPRGGPPGGGPNGPPPGRPFPPGFGPPPQ